MAVSMTYKSLRFENGFDERMLYVMDGDEQFAVINLLDLVENYGDVDEPDYGELAQDVADAVSAAVAVDGWKVDSITTLNQRAHTFVTPGAPYQPEDVTFQVFKYDEPDAPTYGMYTPEGNARVHAIVTDLLGKYESEHDVSTDRVYDIAVGCLDELSDEDGFTEAFDTDVRDQVWSAITLARPTTTRTNEYFSADARHVEVKHDAPRTVSVDIVDTGVPGDRREDVATIALQEVGRWMVMLTWQEARDLAKVLNDVTDTAELG